MEPLSGGASVIAFVSLAVQLADSIKKLSDFWSSIQEAPQEISALVSDLRLISAVLQEIRNDVRDSAPDSTSMQALRGCESLVGGLNALVDDLAPGFTSESRRVRKWTALKAFRRSEKIRKFHGDLANMKSTLNLIQTRLLGVQTYVCRF